MTILGIIMNLNRLKMSKIHPLSDVQSSSIGSNTFIWQYCIVLKNAIIGDNCNINCQVLIENDVEIGNNVTIKPGVQIWDGIHIESDVFIGPNATFTNDLLPRSKKYPEEFAKTILKKGCSIGANATIVAGHTIGKYAMIGAGSVVTKDVKDFALVYGNPAKHRGYITKNSILLSMDLISKDGIQYEFNNGDLVKV